MLDYSLTKLFTLSVKKSLTDFERKIIDRLKREEKAKKSIWYRIYLYIGDLFNWKEKEGKIDRIEIEGFYNSYGFKLYFYQYKTKVRGVFIFLYNDLLTGFWSEGSDPPWHGLKEEEKLTTICVSVEPFYNKITGILSDNLYWTAKFDTNICHHSEEVINYLKSKNHGESWKEVYNFQIKLR